MTFVNQNKIFYGASAFLGLLAIIYFGFEYLVALSPFSISVILFSVFVFFLVVGLRVGGNSSVLAYVFSSGAYVVALFYTLARFDLGSNGVQLSLIFSSGLFAALGYYITQKDFRLDKEQYKFILIGLAVLLAVLIGYDIGSGDVSYSYSLVDEVEVGESFKVGEVSVVKNSLLPYDSKPLSFNGCLYNSTGHPVGVSGFSSSIDTMEFGYLNRSEDILFEADAERVELGSNVGVDEEEGLPRCRSDNGKGSVLKVFADSEGLEILN